MKDKRSSVKKGSSVPRAPRGQHRSVVKTEESSARKDREERWQQLCDELQSEMAKMSHEMAALRAERDQYRKAVLALTYEEVEFDKKTLLAQLGQRPTLEELIAELESQGAP